MQCSRDSQVVEDAGGDFGVGKGEPKIGLGEPPPHGAAQDGGHRGSVHVLDVDGDEGALGEIDPQTGDGGEIIEHNLEATHLDQRVVGVLNDQTL
jgi:hypothetical protein